MRVRSFHVVVQSMRDLKTRPQRIVWRHCRIVDRARRHTCNVRQVMNAGKPGRVVRSKHISRIGDALAESERSVLIEQIHDSVAVVVVVNTITRADCALLRPAKEPAPKTSRGRGSKGDCNSRCNVSLLHGPEGLQSPLLPRWRKRKVRLHAVAESRLLTTSLEPRVHIDGRLHLLPVHLEWCLQQRVAQAEG